MATLESLPISFSRLSYSSNPPLILPARLKISLPTFTSKLHHKSHPYPLTISRNFQVFTSSSPSSTIQEVPVEENEKSEEPQKEVVQNRLFVLNLPWSFVVDDLKKLFSECGTVEDAEIIMRKKDGKSRGYAFVTMSSTDEALSAIQKYDSYELMGRIIRVEFAKENKKSSSSPPASPPGEKRYKLYVSNLAWRVRANHLREFFGELNPVSTRVVFETPEGRSAGYGFVTFATKEEAESAISTFNGKELMDRAITLAFSEKDADKSETEEDNASNEQPAES
ncbi:unnamed protein product [Lactuca virosa]|uniref:RRM domain-containing protein n=1 Tax=Lactuca virosa TaxID=75947 RepID=A0AAU9PN37_9ASTR|nr:unnamed protein product [Lactuca virosa]